jgi:hypothetical protein
MKILYTGLLIDVGGAVALYLIGLYLESQGYIQVAEPGSIDILGYVLLGVSAIELLVIIFLKKKWLTPSSLGQTAVRSFKILKGRIMTLYLILFFVALSPAIYGFLFFLLSGLQDMFTLMACLTLLGYLMVRPRPEFIEKLVEPFEFEQV